MATQPNDTKTDNCPEWCVEHSDDGWSSDAGSFCHVSEKHPFSFNLDTGNPDYCVRMEATETRGRVRSPLLYLGSGSDLDLMVDPAEAQLLAVSLLSLVNATGTNPIAEYRAELESAGH
jgi:hypothetical protein